VAKGKTNSPLVVWVATEFLNSPSVESLRQQGHTVREFGGTVPGMEPDLLLHPAAHWWSEDMWPYLPAALAAARKRRKTKRESS
jgi:hypothetical protein